MDIDVFCTAPGRGRLVWKGGTHACTLGRSGIRLDKREGDGATPAGCFVPRRVLYRPDHVQPPKTRLPASAIAPADGWCDAPNDPAYNRPVTLPYPASAERMWRDDALYDLVVVLGHNDDPVIPGAGSAIFLHLARVDGGPTEGCIGVSPALAMALIEAAGPQDRICIYAGV